MFKSLIQSKSPAVAIDGTDSKIAKNNILSSFIPGSFCVYFVRDSDLIEQATNALLCEFRPFFENGGYGPVYELLSH